MKLADYLNSLLDTAKGIVDLMRQGPIVSMLFLVSYLGSRFKKYQFSVRYYSLCIARAPDYLLAYINRGYGYWRLNNSEMAIADGNAVLEKFPNSIMAHELLCHIYFYEQKFELFIRYALKLNDLVPSSMDYKLAEAYRITDKLAVASSYYLKILKKMHNQEHIASVDRKDVFNSLNAMGMSSEFCLRLINEAPTQPSVADLEKAIVSTPGVLIFYKAIYADYAQYFATKWNSKESSDFAMKFINLVFYLVNDMRQQYIKADAYLKESLAKEIYTMFFHNYKQRPIYKENEFCRMGVDSFEEKSLFAVIHPADPKSIKGYLYLLSASIFMRTGHYARSLYDFMRAAKILTYNRAYDAIKDKVQSPVPAEIQTFFNALVAIQKLIKIPVEITAGNQPNWKKYAKNIAIINAEIGELNKRLRSISSQDQFKPFELSLKLITAAHIKFNFYNNNKQALSRANELNSEVKCYLQTFSDMQIEAVPVDSSTVLDMRPG